MVLPGPLRRIMGATSGACDWLDQQFDCTCREHHYERETNRCSSSYVKYISFSLIALKHCKTTRRASKDNKERQPTGRSSGLTTCIGHNTFHSLSIPTSEL